jgi:excisionase family DNA binding protein
MIGNILSIKEAAEFMNISWHGIYFAIMNGRLAAFKMGKNWKIYQDDLEKYIKSKFERKYDNKNGFYSVEQAAKMLNVSPAHIYYMLKKGEFICQKMGVFYVIHKNDIDTFKKEIRKKDCAQSRMRHICA